MVIAMDNEFKSIHCCGCESIVYARLTDGKEIYSHRPDLAKKPFWKCDSCGNYVGTHHKTKDRTKPLGSIPTKKMRQDRIMIHQLIDPLWKYGYITRKNLYAELSKRLGEKYHTANVGCSLDASEVIARAIEIKSEILSNA